MITQFRQVRQRGHSRQSGPFWRYFQLSALFSYCCIAHWTFAAGGKLFAYQSCGLVVGYSYGYFTARDLLRIGWWLTVVEFVILILLVQFYWPLFGLH
jgi:hypothetical protein